MTGAITLRVAGTPAPQGSKSAWVTWPRGAKPCPTCGNRFGRPRAIVSEGKANSPQRKNLTAWRDAIAAEASTQGIHQPIEGPVRVQIVFALQRPKSYPGWRWLHWVKPDIDKLCRSTLDALTAAQVFKDDAQVVELAVRKVYALDRPTGATIKIESLAEIEERLGHAWALAGGRAPRL